MQHTPNFEFELPQSSDYVGPPNDNFTKVDTELAKRPAVDEETGKLPESALPPLDFEAPLSTAATKDTPVDADSLALVDSADSNKTKRLLWSRVKAVLGAVFAPVIHTHAWSTITGTPTSFTPSAHAATHKTGGADALIPSDIGAAAISHNHSASNITAGILPLVRGGTGVSSIAELLASLNAAGNLQISTQSYVGTGTYGAGNPTRITFPGAPKLWGCAVVDMGGYRFTCPDKFVGQPSGNFTVHPTDLINYNCSVTIFWSGSQVSIYSTSGAADQYNISGKTYYWFAIY